MTDSARTKYDVVVAGCGAMGSSVSYNLARRGLKVLALDRFEPGHTKGSSHGQTRIIRLAYYEDPRYVPMLRRAFESWRELEALTGRRLMTITGGLMMGDPDGELIRGVLRSAEEHSIPHRRLGAGELEEAFPNFTVDESKVGVFEESAGLLFSDDCIRAFVQAGRDAGCDYGFNEPMVSWRSGPGGIEVGTKDRVVKADRLVLAAGAWNKELVEGLVPLQCERQVPFWFSPEPGTRFGAEDMPVFIFEESDGRFFYGLPDVGRGVKVAQTHGGQRCEADTIDRMVGEKDVAPVVDFVRRRIRGLATPPIEATTCLYTNTPDLNFAVGALPRSDGVVLVSACSGHGFKFASVMGEVVSDLVTNGRSGLDVSFLGLDRFRPPA